MFTATMLFTGNQTNLEPRSSVATFETREAAEQYIMQVAQQVVPFGTSILHDIYED